MGIGKGGSSEADISPSGTSVACDVHLCTDSDAVIPRLRSKQLNGCILYNVGASALMLASLREQSSQLLPAVVAWILSSAANRREIKLFDTQLFVESFIYGVGLIIDTFRLCP